MPVLDFGSLSDRELLVHLATVQAEIRDDQRATNGEVTRLKVKVLKAEGAIGLAKWLLSVGGAGLIALAVAVVRHLAGA